MNLWNVFTVFMFNPAGFCRNAWATLRSCGSGASDGGGGLRLLRVASGGGRGLSGQRVHGAQELVGDPAGLAKAAQQGAVNGGRVVSDGVLTGEEEPRDGLRRETFTNYISAESMNQ